MRPPRTALLLLMTLLGSAACKTTTPKDEVVVMVDPDVGSAPGDTPGRSGAAPGAGPRPAILAEPLEPVRGGAHTLPPYLGPHPCHMALAGESPVAKACSAAGLRGALDLMQRFVRRAKDEGINFVCADCHVDEDDYSKLTGQADAEFRKLLFLARPE